MEGEEPTEASTSHCRGEDASTLASNRGSVVETFSARKRELRDKYRHLPSRFKGYEALMDTFDDPAMNVPSGT